MTEQKEQKFPPLYEQLEVMQGFFEKLPSIAKCYPFTVIPKKPLTADKSVRVGAFNLPKLEEMPVGMEIAWNHFLEAIPDDKQVSLINAKYAIACLVLMFCHDTEWQFMQTMELGFNTITAIEKYFYELRSREVTEDEVEEEAEVKVEKKPQSKGGRKSTGDLITSSPETNGLAQKDLVEVG